MHLLCLDTSTPRISVALGVDGMVIGAVQLDGGQRHCEQLAPAIQYLTTELDVKPVQLAGIGVGVGPGLFTGLRVGVTTAKVMAQALRIPVVGIPSLDLVAYPLRHSSRSIVAILDARRHEVFAARYQPVQGGVQRVSEYEVMTPDDVVVDLAARPDEVLLAGDGALLYQDRWRALDRAELAGPEFAAPSAAALVALATARFQREDFEQPWDLHPLYLRKSDAEINWQTRDGAA